MRAPVVATVLALLLLGLIGCSNPNASDSGAKAPESTTSLTLAEGTEPTSLSPLAGMYGLASKFYDGLVRLTGSGTVTPDLADGPIRANDDATRWEATIRDGALFSNGDPLTAEDVAATYRAAVDRDTGSPLAGTFSMLDDVEVDGDTVIFLLSQPYRGFDLLLTVGIAPASLVDGPLDASSLAREPIGSGPYVLEQWRAGDAMVLQANPHRDPAPAVERLVISFIADQNAILQHAAAGEIDGAQLAPALARTFADRPGWTVWANPSADYRAIAFPRNNPAVDDVRVRRALNLAVDRQQMVDGILYGFGSAASTPYSAAQGPVFNPDAVFPHDPAEAGRLLDEAGWRRDGDGPRTKNGTTLNFTVMYFPEDVLRRDLAVAFASDMARIGVTVEVAAVDRPAFTPRIPDDAALIGGGDLPYHPDQHISRMLDGRLAPYDPADPYANPSGYRNATVDKLLERARTAASDDVRDRAHRAIQDEYLADPAMIALVTLEHTYIVRDIDQWSGPEPALEPHEHGVAWGPWWNLEQWQPR